jgi:hypothetical protein
MGRNVLIKEYISEDKYTHTNKNFSSNITEYSDKNTDVNMDGSTGERTGGVSTGVNDVKEFNKSNTERIETIIFIEISQVMFFICIVLIY